MNLTNKPLAESQPNNTTLLGFFRTVKNAPKHRQLKQDINALLPLVIVDGSGTAHTVYANHDIRNLIVKTYFDTKPVDNKFLYLWVETSESQVVKQWQFITIPVEMAVLYPVIQCEKQSASLLHLLNLFCSFKTRALQSFCWALFDDPTLMQTWVALPASKNHHHSFSGGLLVHSLECAYFALRNVELISDMSTTEKELTVLAALLHDIGKVKTLGQQQHTELGRLMDHEKFSLVVLAIPMLVLQNQWSQGANALQYLLSWNFKDGFCRYIGGNIIKSADQLSTSISIQKMAFNKKPFYFHYATLQTGKTFQYVNRITEKRDY